MQIRTEMLKGSMMRRFSSSVGVEPVGSGKCRLEMSLFMQPMIFVPFGIRGMVGGQVRVVCMDFVTSSLLQHVAGLVTVTCISTVG